MLPPPPSPPHGHIVPAARALFRAVVASSLIHVHPPLPLPFLQQMFLTYRNDFRGAATLGPGRAREARWTSGAIPTLDNVLSLLGDMPRPECSHWPLALQDDSAVTPLDAAEGHYEPVINDIARATPTTVLAMSQAFATVIAPLGTAPATRIKAARYWRSCLTRALARGALAHFLPMPPDVLLAMLWDFTAMGASKATLKAVVDAVVARHRAGRLLSPVSGPMAYSRLVRSLGRLLGRQHPHKLSVTRDMVVALLRYKPKNLVEFRNKLATCTVCIGCMRPGEGAQATSCNLQFDSDFLKGLLEYKDCSSLVVNKRKQDQERKGHWMSFGKSADPELDLNYQLGLFMDLAHTRPSSACAATQLRGKRCLTCPPLFPKLLKSHLLMYSTTKVWNCTQATPQGRRLYRGGVGFELAIKRRPARCLDH
jgi:hypothetical protein